MYILSVKHVESGTEFVKLPHDKDEALDMAENLDRLGYEVKNLYDGPEDVDRGEEWIQDKIERLRISREETKREMGL